MPIFLHTTPRRALPRHTFHADLLTYMTARGVDDLTMPLNSRGDLTPAGVIGWYRWNDTHSLMVPVGPFDLTKVTDNQYGQLEAAPTTGLTRELKAGHTVTATAGTLLLWDLSASTQIATVTFTRSGTTLTFSSDPGTTAVDDVAVIEIDGTTNVDSEFGPLRTDANGGLWIPLSGALGIWKGGLYAKGTSAAAMVALKFGGAGAVVVPRSFRYDATCTLAHDTAGAGSYIAAVKIGQLDGTPFAWGAGVLNDGGTWKRMRVESDQPSPVLAAGTACGDPDGLTGVHFAGVLIDNGDSTNAGYALNATQGGLTGGASIASGARAHGGVSWTATTGPDEGIGLYCSSADGSTVEITCTTLEAHWTL